MRAAAFVLLALVSSCAMRPVFAETPPPPNWPRPAAAGLDAQEAMRAAFAMGLETGQAVAAELGRLRARVAELEKLCGDPCKAKAEPTK